MQQAESSGFGFFQVSDEDFEDTMFGGRPDFFIRTCQECSHEQEMKHPESYADDSWKELQCRKCKSVSLDYGTYMDRSDRI